MSSDRYAESEARVSQAFGEGEWSPTKGVGRDGDCARELGREDGREGTCRCSVSTRGMMRWSFRFFLDFPDVEVGRDVGFAMSVGIGRFRSLPAREELIASSSDA